MNVRVPSVSLSLASGFPTALRQARADIRIVDPWFNFRATKYLVQNGFYSFWDWFDDREHPYDVPRAPEHKYIKKLLS